MKRIRAILSSCVLVGGLTACGDAEQQNTPTPEPPPSATTASNQHATFKIGETMNVGYDGDIVHLTITAAQVGGECKYGTVDYLIPSTDADGQLVQLWAEIEAEALNHNTWTMVSDPEVITKDGFTERINPAGDCAPSPDGRSSWSESVDLGEKIRVYGSFRVPTEFEALKFESNRIPREELENASKDAPPASSTMAGPSDEEPGSTEPHVVECLEGTPGPAMWSDGEIRHSEDCFHALGGPAYLEEEAKSGLQPGGAAVNGYGYAPNGARNPSSGEIQTHHGCQEGYISDPDLCAGVEGVIRAADPDGEVYG